MTLELSVVVVTHDSRHLLGDLVASLGPGLEGVAGQELVVVDNASRDGSAEEAERLAPHARVLRCPVNGGYAAGINAGVAVAGASRAVLVCNPDVRLERGCARALLDALDMPATGIAVPRLVGADGCLQYSLRRDPTLLRAAAEALAGGSRVGRYAPLGEVVADPRAYRSPQVVDWAAGAVLLLSRSCLEAVGPWDESYFLYSEEVDYALRARDRGFLVRYTPAAAAVHLGGEAPSSPQLWGRLVSNRVRLFARRHGPVATAAYWGAVTAGEAARAAAGRARSRAALAALLRTPLGAGAAAVGVPGGASR